MSGYSRFTEVKDLEVDGQERDRYTVHSFRSNVHPDHFVVSFREAGVEDSEFGYVDRAKALELAEHFVFLANELAKPDRFDTRRQVVLMDDNKRAELYQVGFTDGINSERRTIIQLFGEQLTAVVESTDDLRTWLRTPR